MSFETHMLLFLFLEHKRKILKNIYTVIFHETVHSDHIGQAPKKEQNTS